MLCKHHFSKNGQVFFHIFWVVTLIMQSRLSNKNQPSWYSNALLATITFSDNQLFRLSSYPSDQMKLNQISASRRFSITTKSFCGWASITDRDHDVKKADSMTESAFSFIKSSPTQQPIHPSFAPY
ncbi:hypothetical protein FGO89_15380 [Lacticaseibacillus paracasei]|nr:hypothetical protein FGO89_15380 [Lacticaseibacillus paracasei]